MVSLPAIGENVRDLKNFIPGNVTLVAVTKTIDADNIRAAVKDGITDIGENKVQEALEKFPYLSDLKIRWHLIGKLQTNKVKKALEIFDLIHSVDSLRLAGFINKEAGKLGKIQKVLLQINISEENTKGGFSTGQIMDCLSDLIYLDNIEINGLMTIGPNTDQENVIRNCFRELKQIKDIINLKKIFKKDLYILSMGMTNDYKIAIEEGSTLVRIGRAIFGER